MRLGPVTGMHHRRELIWADGGYAGSLAEHCLAALALVLVIVKRSDDMRGRSHGGLGTNFI